MKQLLFKIVELEYSCVLESLWNPLLTYCVKKRAWLMILQPILHTSTEEACEDRLAAL